MKKFIKAGIVFLVSALYFQNIYGMDEQKSIEDYIQILTDGKEEEQEELNKWVEDQRNQLKKDIAHFENQGQKRTKLNEIRGHTMGGYPPNEYFEMVEKSSQEHHALFLGEESGLERSSYFSYYPPVVYNFFKAKIIDELILQINNDQL